MTTRANWYFDVEIPEADLADPAEAVADMIAADAIDLRSPEALRGELGELISREGQLYNQGVRCSIRQESNNQATCNSCPLAVEGDGPRAELCQIGQRQERVVTLLMIHQHARPAT